MSIRWLANRRLIAAGLAPIVAAALLLLGVAPAARADIQVVATIPVGAQYAQNLPPAFSPDGRLAYVSNNEADTVTAIDTATQQVLANITVGSAPVTAGFSADGSRAIVIRDDSPQAAIVDTATNSVIGTLTFPGICLGLTTSKDHTTAYVATVGQAAANIAFVDLATMTITKLSDPIQATFPFLLQVSPNGQTLAIAEDGNPGLAVMDTRTGQVTQAPAPGLLEVSSLDFTPDGATVVAASTGDSSLHALEVATNTWRSPVRVGPSVYDAALTPDGKYALAPGPVSDGIWVVDMQSWQVVNVIAAPGRPFDIVMGSDGQAYVTLNGGGQVGVADPAAAALTSVASVGKAPFALALAPDGQHIWAINTGDNTVSVLVNPPEPLPGAPTSVMATAATGSASVAWIPPAYAGTSAITGYSVQASTGGSAVAGATCTTTTTTCTVSALRNGTPYTFTVTATNASGTGPASIPSAPATPTAAPLSAQTLSANCGRLPKRIKRDATTRLVKKGCTTNAGQRVRVTAVGQLRTLATGVKFQLLRGRRGVRVRTFDVRFTLLTTLRAAATSGYAPMQATRVYRVKGGRTLGQGAHRT